MKRFLIEKLCMLADRCFSFIVHLFFDLYVGVLCVNPRGWKQGVGVDACWRVGFRCDCHQVLDSWGLFCQPEMLPDKSSYSSDAYGCPTLSIRAEHLSDFPSLLSWINEQGYGRSTGILKVLEVLLKVILLRDTVILV